MLSGCANLSEDYQEYGGALPRSYASPDGIYRVQTLRVVSNRENYILPDVYGEVVLARKDQRSLALCQALTSGLPSAGIPVRVTVPSSSALPIIENRETILMDIRSVHQLQEAGANSNQMEGSCDKSLSTFDYTRSQIIMRNFHLTGRGPWLVGIDRMHGRYARLDLGDYENADLAQGIEQWKDVIAKNPKSWNDQERASLQYRWEHFLNKAGRIIPDVLHHLGK